LNKKSLGKRSALNAHAAFDEAGGGNMICKINAPLLDPTCERLKLKCFGLLDRFSNSLTSAMQNVSGNPESDLPFNK